MSRTPIDILNLFIVFPGDMLFFLLVIACSQASVFLAYGHRSRFPLEYPPRRYVMATVALVLVWLAMLGAAVVALYGGLDAKQFMPPLERLAYAVSLLLLGWAFLSADFFDWRNRSNLIVFGVAFLLTLLFINTARGWLADFDAGLSFNATDYALLWTAATGCIAAAALLLTALNTRHIVDAPLKALFFFLFVAGSGWDLLQFAQGDVSGNYQGAARLAYAGGLILLPVIIHRLAIALLENSLVEVMLAASQLGDAVPAGSQPSLDSTPRDGISPSATQRDSARLVGVIGAMLDMKSGDAAPLRIVKSTVTALKVDIGALLRLPKDNTADIVAGWDGANAKALAGDSLDMSRQPTLLSAAKRGDATTLLPDHHSDELRDLFNRLGIDGLSSLVAQPMAIRGQPVGILAVGSPYQQADLVEEDLALLAEIAAVGGHLLAARDTNNFAPSTPIPAATHNTDPDMALDIPHRDAIVRARREMTASLQTAAERITRLELQIGGLEKQLGDEQERLLDHVAQSRRGESIRADANSALCEQRRLHVEADADARDLLDAEAALRLLNGGERHDRPAQEYLHKRYNLLLNTRDRLRRQVSGLAALRRASPIDAHTALQHQLQDESAQMALQRDQLQRRREAISGKLRQQGADDFGLALLPALAHITAERQAWLKLLAREKTQVQASEAERQALLNAGAGDMQTLESRLKQMTADHDALLESRESMRREQHAMQDALAAQAHEKTRLVNNLRQLESSLADEQSRQAEAQRQLDALAAERDNLLAIRDHLTAKVAELLDDDSRLGAVAELQNELEVLRKTVARLSQQREDLALDLSDARLFGAQAALNGQLANGGQALTGMLRDMRAPIDTLRAYVDLLLDEQLGILGAAQLSILRLAAAEIADIAAALPGAPPAASDQLAGTTGRESFDIASVIDDVIADARARYAARNLLIDLSLDNEIPLLATDCAGLQHMLAQLMTNACKASPLGGQVHVSARVGRALLPGAKDRIDALEFRVQDAGGGIAAADYPRIFSRAYQSAYPAIQGLGDNGIGMSVARAIARARKGDIWVTNESSRGATFYLAVPLQMAARREA